MGGSSRAKILLSRISLAGIILCGTAAAAPPASPPHPSVQVDADGTVHVPAMTVPMSRFLSREGKAYVTEHLKQMQNPKLRAQRKGIPSLIAGYITRQKKLFPVHMRDTTIAGVHAYVYTPKDGVSKANGQRVLINLHGGGFSGCFPACAELESMPVASLGRIEVISLDYREAPKYQFPAASEDVAAVYRYLLKKYPAKNIGIYGCSAGGMLTGMSMAWFQVHALPIPGAIGMFCAGATMTNVGFGGDSGYTAAAIGEARLPRIPPAGKDGGKPENRSPLAYFANAKLDDPLVAPAVSLDVLRRFPPTLIITGTRGFELSSAVYTHSLLDKVGVDAELHVWEGMFHGFFYNPDVPESRDAYNVMVRFFDRHLGH
jgi:acetyl esterase/lipase